MREVEARLRLSAVDRTAKAFDAVQRRIRNVEKQTNAFNRASNAVNRTVGNNALALAARYAAPAALAYAAKDAFLRFATVERQLTRTGIKLGATRGEMKDLYGDLTRLGQKYALVPDQVIATADAYAETGATLKDVKSDIDILLKAQQAMGSEGADVVNTWDAGRKSFGLMTKDAGAFFDTVAAGGAAGKFEGSDLARYLPSLLPVAAGNGMTGVKGTEQIVAALEAQRNFVGTSEEAATAVRDFMIKINSRPVEKNFAKAGINLSKELKKAKTEGKDLLTVMSELINKATKGDASQINKFFPEQDSARFAAVLLTHMDDLLAMIQRVHESSKGMIDNSVNKVLDNTQAKVDRLAASFDVFKTRAGGSLADALNPVLDSVNNTDSFLQAEQQGADAKHMSAQDLFWWRMTTGKSERAKFAFANGWRSSQYSDQGPMSGSPELPSHRQADEPIELRPLGKGEKSRKQILPSSIAIPGYKPDLGNSDLTAIHYPNVPTFDIAGIRAEQQQASLASQGEQIKALKGQVDHYLAMTGDAAGDVADTLHDNATSWWGGTQNGSSKGGRLKGRYRSPWHGPAGGTQTYSWAADIDTSRFGPVDAPKNINVDALRTAMEDGGSHAAEDIKKAAQGLIDAGNAIAAALKGVGSDIGRDAAASFKAGAAGVVVGVRQTGGQLATGNVGRSMPNAGEARPFGGDKT